MFPCTERELEIKMYYFNYMKKCVIKLSTIFIYFYFIYLFIYFLYSSLKTQTQIVAIASSLNDRII